MTRKSALLRLFCVSVIWGCNNVILSYLLHSFSPIFLSFVRILMTTVLLLLIVPKEGAVRRPVRKEWLLLIGTAVFGTVLNQIFVVTGLRYATAGDAALINSLGPIFTIIMARFFLNEVFTFYKGLGSVLSFLGVFIIIWFKGGAFGQSIGDVFLFGAMLSFAISSIFVRKLTATMSTFDITLYSTVMACCFLTSASGIEWLQGGLKISFSPYLWFLVAFIGIIGQCLTGLWWNSGIGMVGAGTTSMFINIQPFITLLVAHYALGDAIYIAQIVGGLLILIGVAIANKTSKAKPVNRNQLSEMERVHSRTI